MYFSWQRKSKGERDCGKEPWWKWQNRTLEGGRAHRLHWWAVQCSWYWLFTRISAVLYPQIQQIWVQDIQCSTQRNIWWCLMDKQMETLSSVYQNMVKHWRREEGPSIDARNEFHNKGDSHRGWFFIPCTVLIVRSSCGWLVELLLTKRDEIWGESWSNYLYLKSFPIRFKVIYIRFKW